MALVWVLAEQGNGRATPGVLELIAAARSVGDAVEAVSWGDATPEFASILGAHGVARIHNVGDIADSLPAPRVAAAIAHAVGTGSGPDVLFIATSYDGRDIAARCSARLDQPVLANIVGLSRIDGTIVCEHALFGGTVVASACLTAAGLGIYVIRPKTFAAEETGGPPAEVVALTVPSVGAADGAQVIARHAEQRSGPSLDEAPVVVSGGRGLGAPEHYGLIEDLAQLLHGAPGASRAIVDAGWVPYSYQVGQTGRIVKPECYLAFGISGATQHLVGMKGAKRIIAVNKDASAPILSISDLGVVGDALSVLPKLIAALKERG